MIDFNFSLGKVKLRFEAVGSGSFAHFTLMLVRLLQVGKATNGK